MSYGFEGRAYAGADVCINGAYFLVSPLVQAPSFSTHKATYQMRYTQWLFDELFLKVFCLYPDQAVQCLIVPISYNLSISAPTKNRNLFQKPIEFNLIVGMGD